MTRIRIAHLYPRELNIYADRGNLLVLKRRAEWRGIPVEVTPIGVGDVIGPDAHDLYYLGGGQDRDQLAVARDLVATKADALGAAMDGGAVLLAVCGGYQLAGAGYTSVSGERMVGAGLLDVDTIAGSTRLIGNMAIEAELDGERHVVVGFENHAGRTRLGPHARPLGRVLHGHGNNGEDGGEGVVQGRAIGTYLHGPLFPKNPWLADVVLGWALGHAAGPDAPRLAPVDDALETEAHAVALDRAARPRADRLIGRRRRAP
ncbi:MAG: glutamine amidotransferase [Actinobacteria bacterium]|nr:glutamine amidotransferase [Actinomycetota bacterium]